ncbi:MAG: hypothetical protein H6737_21210 [Alphaproteobacteria bacterium]|nr:hypothetical protein [Alphaproteobacteria bacterium]
MGTVLFDALCLQAMAEQQTGERMSGPGGLFDVLERAGHTVRLGGLADLGDAQVLVLTTRHQVPYTLDEALAISAWVHAGGGLFCLSNHGLARAGMVAHNATVFDQTIASCFGTAFEPSWNRVKPTALMTLGVVGPLAGREGWPVAGDRTSSRVDRVTCNNCCGIFPSAVARVAVPLDAPGLRAALVDAPTTPGLAWASTIEGGPAESGRVVLCADSGWLGNTTSRDPGPGLFQLEDNAQLALNAVTWLSGG